MSQHSLPRQKNQTLIPTDQGTCPSYWCTWGSQNFAVDEETFNHVIALGDHSVPANNLTESNVFGANGWATNAFTSVRKDLYILMDVGWDVPTNGDLIKHPNSLGSLIVAEDKFPSCTGSPTERLRKLNALSQRAGWRGAGLWVAAHPASTLFGEDLTDYKKLQEYYEERLKWSQDAGIRYWKVDYGDLGGNLKFRRLLTECGHRIAPDLIIEHARCGAPTNDEECPWENGFYSHSGSYRAWDNGKPLQTSVEIIKFSDVFRTYDVLSQLSIPTTLDRVAECLTEVGGTGEGAWLNCEDEPFMGAVLGCLIGIMRHPAWKDYAGKDYDPENFRKREDEVIRSLHWQRIAPPWRSGETVIQKSEKRLEDRWLFAPGDTWAKWLHHKEVMQSAPAITARNLELPKVECEGEPPYILASRHPKGAVAVGCLPRRQPGFGSPAIELRFSPKVIQYVGVFGHLDSLVLHLEDTLEAPSTLAQDLLGGEARDISAQCDWSDCKLTIPGNVLNEIGLSAATLGDLSEPATVLQLSW